MKINETWSLQKRVIEIHGVEVSARVHRSTEEEVSERRPGTLRWYLSPKVFARKTKQNKSL